MKKFLTKFCALLLGTAALAGSAGLAASASTPLAGRAGATQMAGGSASGPVSFRVMLDPGHGGKDPGAASASLLEKDLNLELARRLKQKLEASRIQVEMTRDGDQEVLLKARAERAQTVQPDCLVSLHLGEPQQAGPAYELLYHSHSGLALAQVLNESLNRQIPLNADQAAPLHWHNAYILREAGVPAVLVSGDFNLLTKPEAQARLVEGLASGVLSYASRQSR